MEIERSTSGTYPFNGVVKRVQHTPRRLSSLPQLGVNPTTPNFISNELWSHQISLGSELCVRQAVLGGTDRD